MRLVCPNCDAEYEVDAAAIPLTGRDVQCSNCGHAWFQTHPEMAVDAGLQDTFDGAAAMPEPETEPEPESEPEPEPVDEIGVTGPAVPPAPRPVDEKILAVLREEAEREAAARRDEAVAAKAPVIETQTEMPLAQDQSSMTAAVRRIARLRSAEPEPVVVPPPAPPPASPPKSRRELLPAIEEINSTLRATSDRNSHDDNAISDTMNDGVAASRRFRSGFLMLVLLAVVLVVLYVVAPLIAVRVPALAGPALGYVALADAARLGLDRELRALIDALRELAGSKGD
ncbi:MAG: zinc-ribbon domain-containing protein [Pseudorhodobacter sp.]|nr:zinc-ribbon domain-containing protein [Pseudorhodobacter sp.]